MLALFNGNFYNRVEQHYPNKKIRCSKRIIVGPCGLHILILLYISAKLIVVTTQYRWKKNLYKI